MTFTKKDIARQIDWFGDDEHVDFFEVDWRFADETGEVVLRGETELGEFVEVVVVIQTIEVEGKAIE